MPATTHTPLAPPIVAIRLLSRHPAAGTPQAARVQTLLDLGVREQQRVAEGHLVERLLQAAQRALADLPAQVGSRLDEIAALAVELGLGVAREIVGQALDQGLVDPTPTVARCLRDCVHGASPADLVVRLHPDDLALVQQRLRGMQELQTEVAAARLVADPTIPRGGVRAETDAGRLRYDPREALERVAAEVRREAAS
jgi:flagellar biosynthesis/type III secretory pathway protein FliH